MVTLNPNSSSLNAAKIQNGKDGDSDSHRPKPGFEIEKDNCCIGVVLG